MTRCACAASPDFPCPDEATADGLCASCRYHAKPATFPPESKLFAPVKLGPKAPVSVVFEAATMTDLIENVRTWLAGLERE